MRREELGLTQERLAEALDLPLGVLLASSGWVGAEEAFASPQDAPDTDANAPVALDNVLEEAKEVVTHLQVLVDAAEAAQADNVGPPANAGYPHPPAW